jgi:hypothetical protein
VHSAAATAAADIMQNQFPEMAIDEVQRGM